MDWRIGGILTVICFISIFLNFGYRGEIKQLKEEKDELWKKLAELERKINH